MLGDKNLTKWNSRLNYKNGKEIATFFHLFDM